MTHFMKTFPSTRLHRSRAQDLTVLGIMVMYLTVRTFPNHDICTTKKRSHFQERSQLMSKKRSNLTTPSGL
ncbi:unnamed protein product [Calypogeia fissa]